MNARRITQIDLKDYRAFYGAHRIRLEKGENLLVYGENGSGKSSLYQAVRAFLQSSATPLPLGDFANIWQSAGATPEIRLGFSEFDPDGNKTANTEADFAANDPALPPYVKKANLSKGFFSYRELLKTYLVDPGDSIAFFDLFLEVILADFVYPGTGRTLLEEWQDIGRAAAQYALDLTKPGISPGSLADPRVRFTAFDAQLQAGLLLIGDELNAMLVHFRQGLEVELSCTSTVFSAKGGSSHVIPPVIEIQVSLFEQHIAEHYHFLNEARLSALALCIYLAALKTNPSKEECRILFLDDAFIGLDMGNRLPLLDILNDRFAEYQIFMTTYDRAWFELAGDHLPGKWKSVEMYATEKVMMEHSDGSRHVPGSVEHPPGSREIRFESPLVVDRPADPYEQAKLYFEAKDYPAAGNALRKACEKALKKYLPEGYLLTGSGEARMLGEMLEQLREYFKDAGQTIPPTLLAKIAFFKKAILNPASHHDLRSNFYRGEIQKLFDVVQELRNLPQIAWTPILHPGQQLNYEYPPSNFKLHILAGSYIYKTKFNGNVSISKLNFYPEWWEKGGLEYWNPKSGARYPEPEIARMTDRPQNESEIASWIQRHTNPANIPTCLKEFKTDTDTLENLLNK